MTLKRKMVKEFKKVKLPFKKDEEVKKELDDIALKLAEDTSLKDVKVFSHKDIIEALNKRKARVCWCCRSMNCLTKQKLSFKHKIAKAYVGKCKGKQLTFSELLKESKDNKPAESNTASTNIKPPTNTNYDSDASELGAAMNGMENYQNTQVEEFGYGHYSVDTSTTRIPVSPETIPSYEAYLKTANDPDEGCMICLQI